MLKTVDEDQTENENIEELKQQVLTETNNIETKENDIET